MGGLSRAVANSGWSQGAHKRSANWPEARPGMPIARCGLLMIDSWVTVPRLSSLEIVAKEGRVILGPDPIKWACLGPPIVALFRVTLSPLCGLFALLSCEQGKLMCDNRSSPVSMIVELRVEIRNGAGSMAWQ